MERLAGKAVYIYYAILEKCLAPTLQMSAPPLDLAQGGFRPARSSLDQVLCLTELCRLHRLHHKVPPALAFLDIKSAYDTVDRRIIWHALAPTSSPSLLRLLQHLFDDVLIEFLLNNHRSHQFSPTTGVLQGSILSPFLYSIYINTLPALLRPHPPELPPATISDLTSTLTCLLYADDVVLVGTPATIRYSLTVCEEHSHSLGYRWSPSKCVILSPPSPSADPPTYQLYNTDLPTLDNFSYLGIPIKPGGQIDTKALITHNTTKALTSMHLLSSIGVNGSGYNRLTSTRLYHQFIRPQMEYGLAIATPTKGQQQQLERAQYICIRRLYNAHLRSSTHVMKHLTATPSMTTRLHTLQLKFVHRATHLPHDTLLFQLISVLPTPRTRKTPSLWHKLLQQPLASQLIQIDPLLKIPMTKKHRSRCIRWRLGWLTGGSRKPCTCQAPISKTHIISCHHHHARLSINSSLTSDPLSYILNRLPHHPPASSSTRARWLRSWSTIKAILLELEYLQHPQHQETAEPDDDPFITVVSGS
ncbi:hypothetical protein [Absidia glauca]|uniref:Reverse transcriptase domain-containing protein n=1 Tax=Absidia glauca TaxID=4829 RepID=A0A168LAY6_ABSGL|nr:hypothetical protein [Absidia glauca]